MSSVGDQCAVPEMQVIGIRQVDDVAAATLNTMSFHAKLVTYLGKRVQRNMSTEANAILCPFKIRGILKKYSVIIHIGINFP